MSLVRLRELAGRERLEDERADAGRLQPALDVERDGGGREREQPVARRLLAASCARRGCRRAGPGLVVSSAAARRLSSPSGRVAFGRRPRSPSAARRRRPRPSASRARRRPGSLRDLRELAVELRPVVGGEVLEGAGGGELVDRRRRAPASPRSCPWRAGSPGRCPAIRCRSRSRPRRSSPGPRRRSTAP